MNELSRQSRFALRGSALAAALALVGCATTGPSRSGAFARSTMPRHAANARVTQAPPPGWRIATMEHVDLWLHGYAMLTSDTGHVPFFARGYKQEIKEAKRQKNIYTNLDANQTELSQRFAANPALANGQFLAMYFTSFQEIATATDAFIRSNGDPRAARDPQLAQRIAMLASMFRSQADRNWLRLFVQSLQDESTKFYHTYWTDQQTARGAAFSAVSELWSSKGYPKLSRFLNNTQQPNGQFVLSIPLGGEGRTVNDGKQSNIIATEFPKTIDAAPEALFTFIHEAVGQLAQEAITDNTTPAEQRLGVTNEYVGNGAVRGGAILLQRILPELVPDYMRFYLRTLGRTPSAGDPTAAFAAAFPLPPAILAGLTRQIDVVLGGI
jgi:hypothetical protein